MAEKKIQPKAAGTEKSKTTLAAAGVEKKSLRRTAHKRVAKRTAKKI